MLTIYILIYYIC
uniref:Uncharacterized protein n=1 Tax=Anguilla anguilla TaxID=7936 RepID=A0A0E9W2Y6_ANGAN